MKIAALAGGVGGSKLCAGLAEVMDPSDLCVVVNIGDDFIHHGLKVCPDLDTVCYTLAGMNNSETGWGLAGETWNFSRGLEVLGGETWFKIGDRDLATHVERTELLRKGLSLTEVTKKFCRRWGLTPNIFPACDQEVSTFVKTRDGVALPFQEYFVKQGCSPEVVGFEFAGISKANPDREVIEGVSRADWIIICPSNPWVSIDPIIKIPAIAETLREKKVLAVSPLINGKALKGPAAKMYTELGIPPSAASVAGHYRGILKAFALDTSDAVDGEEIRRWGIIPLLTNIRMPTQEERRRLANELLAFCQLH